MSTEKKKTAAELLKAAEERRAVRKRNNQEAIDAQRAVDIIALDDAEVAYGDGKVRGCDFEYIEGLPTIAVMKAPAPILIARYRSTVRPRKGEAGDTVTAAEALAIECLVYPDSETFERMCEQRPSFKAFCGLRALELAGGSATADAKS